MELTQWRARFAAEIVGEAREVTEALDTLRRVADAECTVLITGETGTGKELFARATHRASRRAGKAFISVNCAAIPDALLESELFGHVKGAFTGASGSRAGRFVAAAGGTVFLDEIGDLPLSAQAKLLRVLEERVVTPVGADLDLPVDVRIIAATHRDLRAMVAAGTFRADLYFRLAVVPIHLPALRDRGADLDRLVDVCIGRAAERAGREITGIDACARAALHAYRWPGNIRELAHLVERSVLLARTPQLAATDFHMPDAVPEPAPPAPPPPRVPTPAIRVANLAAELGADSSLDLRGALDALERQLIDRALTKTGGNQTAAAALLGVNRTTLVEKLRKYGGLAAFITS